MAKSDYEPCAEFTRCGEIIEKYYSTGDYETCFKEHMKLALKGYPLAECQIGYFYMQGLGVEQNYAKALYWNQRAAKHGDRDAQCNLAEQFESGLGTPPDLERAKYWYGISAKNGCRDAVEKCRALGI
jgi:TPR repeat protein